MLYTNIYVYTYIDSLGIYVYVQITYIILKERDKSQLKG